MTSSSDDSEIDLTKSDLTPESIDKRDPENNGPNVPKEIMDRIDALETNFKKVESDINKVPVFLDEFAKSIESIIELKFKQITLPQGTQGGGGLMDLAGPIIRAFTGGETALGGSGNFNKLILDQFNENFSNTLAIQQLALKAVMKDLQKRLGLSEHIVITPK